jgi:hypothetical protein
MLYGALEYNTSCNLGDNIQTIAAMQYLPRIDVWIDRDSGIINDPNISPSKRILTIYNGWFNFNFWKSIHDRVIPLFYSFHIENDTHENDKNYDCIQQYRTPFQPSIVDRMTVSSYPKFTRDIESNNILQKLGMKSLFGGCLTLMLRPSNPTLPKNGTLLVDVDKNYPWISNLSYVTTSTQYTKSVDNVTKIKEAHELLDLIENSELVITTRLHTTLSSIAFKTPVILLTKNPNDPRFQGLLEYIPHCDPDNFLTETVTWDSMVSKYKINELLQKVSRMVESLKRLLILLAVY